MNDLGLTLAWLAVQVALLLAPALVLHALASRRGPAAGAWVAVLSLGLVVVLNVAAFVPGIGWNDKVARTEDRTARDARLRSNRARRTAAPESTGPDVIHPAGRTRPGARLAAAGLGPARARGGRAGGAVPAVGEHPGGRRAGRDGRRPAPPDDRALGGRPLLPTRAAGRRPGR